MLSTQIIYQQIKDGGYWIFPLDGIFLESLVAGSRDPAVLLSGDSGIPKQISLCPGIPECNLTGFGGRELGNI